MRMLIKAAALAAFLLPAVASAQQVLTLRGAPSDGDGRITAGDVFDNAGALASVVLGYRNGATAILDAATVQSVVGANGGYWANPRGQRRIVVIAGADGADGATTTVNQPRNPFAGQPSVPQPAAQAFAATPVAAVPAPAMAMAGRGPVMVHRSETIDVTWSAGGISLTMSGVAQKDAAAGESVAVQNPASKKMIDAVVTGPGHAVAGPGADRYRTAALQLSSR